MSEEQASAADAPKKKTRMPCPRCHHINRVVIDEAAMASDGQDEICVKCGVDYFLIYSKTCDHLVAIEA